MVLFWEYRGVISNLTSASDVLILTLLSQVSFGANLIGSKKCWVSGGAAVQTWQISESISIFSVVMAVSSASSSSCFPGAVVQR